MPNILAHTHITRTVLDRASAEVVLGSILPDFASMYKARYGGYVAIRGASPKLDRGIELHNQTDSVFDSQPEQPLITESLASALMDEGITYQAARLSAAFAADILLDRALLDFDEATSAFTELGESVEAGQAGLDQLDTFFASHVLGYFQKNVPRFYRDDRHIASIISHRLSNRSIDPQKTIEEDQLTALAETIGAQAEYAGELGLKSLTKTIKILRSI